MVTRRVLIFDINRIYAKLIKEFLEENWQLEVYLAHDEGQLASKVKEDFDCVLADIDATVDQEYVLSILTACRSRVITWSHNLSIGSASLVLRKPSIHKIEFDHFISALQGKIVENNIYKVGIDKIDSEHNELINIANTIYTHFVNNGLDSECEKLFRGLCRAVSDHFDHEDEIFCNIQDIVFVSAHRKEHEALVKELIEYEVSLDSSRLLSGLELLIFMHDWLLEHILKFDKQIPGYLDISD